MPPNGSVGPDFDNATDKELQQFFDSNIEGTPEFSDLVAADQVPKGTNADLTGSINAISSHADLVGGQLGANAVSLRDIDWSFEFSRLSRGQRVNLVRGWTEQYAAISAPVSPVIAATGGGVAVGGKPMGPVKWFGVGAIVVVLGIGAYAFTEVIPLSDDDTPEAANTVTTEPVTSSTETAVPTESAEPTETAPAAAEAPAPAAEPDPADEPEPESEPEEAEVASSPPPEPGVYEITGSIASACGGDYDVFLRMILFLNGQMTVDQLLTAGGNAFQSATGYWNAERAVATIAGPTLFEVWFFLFHLGDILSIHNVYGATSPLVATGSEVDLDDYADVTDAEGLDQVTNGTESCAANLTIDDVGFSYHPD